MINQQLLYGVPILKLFRWRRGQAAKDDPYVLGTCIHRKLQAWLKLNGEYKSREVCELKSRHKWGSDKIVS
jgi:hypothetical protein